MQFLYILCALALLVLFFPIWVKIILLRTHDDGTIIAVQLWRWTLWTNAPKPEPAPHVNEPVVEPRQQEKVRTVESIPKEHNKLAEPKQPEQVPTVPVILKGDDKKTPPESSTDRAFVALALNSRLENEAIKLTKALLVSLWHIFKIRIPILQVNFGLDNPAQMGWMAGGIWTMQALTPCPPGWEYIPSWGVPGLGGLRTEVRIHMNMARLLRFLFVSAIRLLRVSWIGWRLYKQYKTDPQQMGLSAWRRWILNKLSPLVTEVQNDQA